MAYRHLSFFFHIPGDVCEMYSIKITITWGKMMCLWQTGTVLEQPAASIFRLRNGASMVFIHFWKFLSNCGVSPPKSDLHSHHWKNLKFSEKEFKIIDFCQCVVCMVFSDIFNLCMILAYR